MDVMSKLTFKQYLESREQLLKAVENTPISFLEYDIRKYCTLQVGEEDEKQLISLKPKHKIIVEWSYENIDNPQPQSIKYLDEQYDVFWDGNKLTKWLQRHAHIGKEMIYQS